MSYDYREFYRRKLPHLHRPGATLFVTTRLSGSIPQAILRRWRAERAHRDKERGPESPIEFERRWFGFFEDILDKGAYGPRWLGEDRIAQIVADSLRYRDERVYRLHAYSIMPTHTHIVFTPLLDFDSIREVSGSSSLRFESDHPPLDAIMKSLKGYTARQANKLLGRTGSFWDEESYDHEVRNQAEFYRVVKYVLNNPVKAGLVDHWSKWKWNYVRDGLRDSF